MGTHSVSFLRNESRLRRRVARGKFFSASDSFALPTDSAFGLAGRAMALKSAFCKILGRAYALKFARWATDGNERSTCIVTTPQFLQAQFSNRLRAIG